MYRFRLYQQVLYGHYNEFYAAVEELNAVEKSKGRAAMTVWAPTIGENNLVVLESEYSDLASFQKESDAFGQDPDSMRVFRSMAPFVVQGSARTELWESAVSMA